MSVKFRSPGATLMAAHLMRLVLVAVLVVTTLGGLGENARAVQPATNSWTEPDGAFSVQWVDPWVVQRQESGLLAVANGTAVAVATRSFPATDLNPSLCLEAYVDAVADPEVKVQEPFMEGKTTWRAYAAYDNLQIGVVDYFECQLTPDGSAFAVFAGGTTLIEKYGNIPMLIDFLGQWVVRPDGERAPVVAAEGWRFGVVDWVRGSVYNDLGLSAAPSGTDYLVVVADLSNWASLGEGLPLSSIGALAAGSDALIPVDLEASRIVAETLGEQPVEDLMALPPGTTRRVVLVFQVPTDAQEIGLSLAGTAMSIVDNRIPARLVSLPSPGTMPGMQSGIVANVIDGRTLLVTMADTGENERVRLIGVDAPQASAAEFLTAYVGQNVQLESDPNHPDDNRLQRYVWVTGPTGAPAMLNESLIEGGHTAYDMGGAIGRFDAMLATGSALSTGAAAGDQEGAAPAADSATAELTDADLAYLAELARYRDLVRVSIQFYDNFLVNPTLDQMYFGQLGIAVLGWTTFYTGIARLEPTPRFAELHARLIAAYQPFYDLSYQIEPELDAILAGQTPQTPFAGFDYDVMSATVANARPALESVLAEIDAELQAAGIQTDSAALP